MPQKSMTMQSLADDLALSRTTVSLVLKGEAERFRISPETRDRVLSRARALGFRPNYFASALNSGKAGVIGLILPNVFEGFMAEMIRGMEDILRAGNAMLMVSTSMFNPELERRTIEEFIHRGADGLVLVPYAPFSGERRSYDAYRAIEENDIPHVYVDRCPAGLAGPRVLQEDHDAACRATRLLVRHGARHIGYVGFDMDIGSIRDRYRGYRKALGETGCEAGPVIRLRERNRNSADLTEALARAFADPAAAPDAFFVSTNGLSYRVHRILEQLKVPPVRIAKFGTDPEDWDTGMIQVRQPHYEMGREAIRLLFEAINAPDRPKRDGRAIVVPTGIVDPAVPARENRHHRYLGGRE